MSFKLSLCSCALVLLASAAFAQTRDENVTRCGGADPVTAVTACSALIESDKEKPADLAAAYNNRGNAYMDRGNLGTAVDDFEQAAKLDPRFTGGLVVIANIYRAAGDEVGALQYLDEAIRRSPTAANFNSRASLYVAIGDLNMALADYDQAVQRNSNSADILTARCHALTRVGKAEAALADCGKALGLRPGNPVTLDNRAYAYLKLGRFADAIADGSAALAVNPQRVTSLYARGLAKRKSGDAAGGAADIAAAEAILPDIANRMERIGVTP